MPFGIPNSSDLNGLADKIGSIIASLGPEEAAVISGAISQLSDHAAALEAKAAADLLTDVKAVEDPLLVRLDALIALAQKFEVFAGGFDIGVMPKVAPASRA